MVVVWSSFTSVLLSGVGLLSSFSVLGYWVRVPVRLAFLVGSSRGGFVTVEASRPKHLELL